MKRQIDTPEWVRDAIFYQIFPDRFARSNSVPKPSNLQPWGAPPTRHGYQGGDLVGIGERLDYLADLGVNAILLNPIFASASNHRYHTYDYYRIDPVLGSKRDFDDLLAVAHRQGIRVVLDGVFNHASRGFYQFNHLLENGPESPYTDWFTVYGWPVNAYAQHEQPNYAAWWNLHALPKFNTQTPAVREFLWGVAAYWLEQGADGWRLDVPAEIADDDFWREFRRRCRSVNPKAYIVGELWDDAQRWLGGDQFDGQMNYMFARAAIGFFLGENADQRDTVKTGYGHIPTLDVGQFAAELDRFTNRLYHPDIVLAQMTMLGSHDTPRLMTIARGDTAGVRLMFLCQMTMPGAPNIYYGDEIGLPGGRDPDCRRAFPWNDEQSWNEALRSDLKKSIALRRSQAVLRQGDFAVLHANDSVVVYERTLGEQRAIVALNAGGALRHVPIRWSGNSNVPLVEELAARPTTLRSGQEVRLPARSGRVWLTKSN